MGRAARQRRYRERQAAGLRVVAFALPAEVVDRLEAAGLLGQHADEHSLEVEDLVAAVLAGLAAAEGGDASPRPLRLR